jgi:cytochrome c2
MTQLTSLQSLVIPILFCIPLLFAECRGTSNTKLEYVDSIRKVQLKQNEELFLIRRGKVLFNANCRTCHSVFKTENYLARVVDRVGPAYLKLLITKQDSLLKAKDKYNLKLKEVFGRSANTHNYRFSDDQLNAIIAFLQKYSG